MKYFTLAFSNEFFFLTDSNYMRSDIRIQEIQKHFKMNQCKFIQSELF